MDVESTEVRGEGSPIKAVVSLSEATGTTQKPPECFVAMWFGSDIESIAAMNQLYEIIIKPAIEEQNLTPYHVGKDLGADKLDDAIMEAIDRSVLVVVDLTHDPQTGLRGSVVFEAGYAYSRKPVIWMCRDDLAGSTPFDIRQFHQIRWNPNRLVEARELLASVIEQRIKERQVSRENHEIWRLIANKWDKIMSMVDIPLPESNGVVPADQSRFIMLEELCDDLDTRAKYKEMGLSQDERYELIEMVRGIRKFIVLLKSKNRVFGTEQYKKLVYPRLRAAGWIA